MHSVQAMKRKFDMAERGKAIKEQWDQTKENFDQKMENLDVKNEMQQFGRKQEENSVIFTVC